LESKDGQKGDSQLKETIKQQKAKIKELQAQLKDK
jgi:hypothetical protein